MFYRFKRILRHLRPQIVHELFLEHNLGDLETIKPKLPVRIVPLAKNNIECINQVRKNNLKLLKERLNRGDLCLTTEYSGKTVSYHWVQFKGEHLVQQTNELMVLKEKEAVIYHVRVHPDLRGNRINGFVYGEILKKCKNMGLNRVWIYTNCNNKPNLKSLIKLGFKSYRKTMSLKVNTKYYLLKNKFFK